MIDLKRALAVLHAENVEFIIIGGMAARAHGSARGTDDVDVVYERSEDNIRRLVKALAPFNPSLRGAPPGLPFEWSAKTVKAGLNFTLQTTLGPVDILGEVTGGGAYKDLIAHSIDPVIFGRKTNVVELPWLIRLKRAAGRPRDFEAIAELELLRDLGDSSS
jgi:predicted nucleotidyltransferase